MFDYPAVPLTTLVPPIFPAINSITQENSSLKTEKISYPFFQDYERKDEANYNYDNLLNKWTRGQGAKSLLLEYLTKCSLPPLNTVFTEKKTFQPNLHGFGKHGYSIFHKSTVTITHSKGTFTGSSVRYNKKEAEKIACAKILDQLESEGLVNHQELIYRSGQILKQSLSPAWFSDALQSHAINHHPTTVTDRWISNPKSYLLEYCRKLNIEIKNNSNFTGPPHSRKFAHEVCMVYNGEKLVGYGIAKGKKEAERLAYYYLCVELDNSLFWGCHVKVGEKTHSEYTCTNSKRSFDEEWNEVQLLCKRHQLPLPSLRLDHTQHFFVCTIVSPSFINNIIQSESPDEHEAKYKSLKLWKDSLLRHFSEHSGEELDNSVEHSGYGKIVSLDVSADFEACLAETLECLRGFKDPFLSSIYRREPHTSAIREELDASTQLFAKYECSNRAKENRDYVLLDSLLKNRSNSGINFLRRKLPSYTKREEILEMIGAHQCLVITGETGSGKTTQVPQYVLEELIENYRGSQARIVVTQPRRLSAITVAERVAHERGESLGDSIGYQVRMDSVLPFPDGCITFCTTGVLLSRLSATSDLAGVSHVFVDEVHERSLEIDLLLAMLKEVMTIRPDLRVILMSATVNPAVFCHYFNCPLLEISGKSYAVKSYFLEDCLSLFSKFEQNCEFLEYVKKMEHSIVTKQETKLSPYYPLITNLIGYIVLKLPPGGILVFLPGIEEINAMHTKIKNLGYENVAIELLHSSLGLASRRFVFEPAPEGVYKVILSTNIAETSVTIPDVVYVIDSGMLKEMEYYPETCMQSLTTKWISLSNFRQRRGRAGRVRSGYYFSLISETLLPYLLEFQTPEIVRSDLMGLCLKAKALHVSNVIDFSKKCIQPPDIHLVNGCLHRLKRLQAFDEREELTPLGWQLSKLPLSPTLGKALIYACFFRCIDPILTIIASMTLRDPFDISPDSKKEVSNSRFLFGQAQRSDHLTLFFLFNQWQSTLLPDSLIQEHDFINKHCLSKSTLSQISELRYYLYNALADAGLVDKYHFTRTSNELIGGPRFNENSSDLNLLKGLLVIAMYPNVSYRVGRKMFKTKHDLRIKIHPSSVVYRDAAGVQSLFYMFQGKVKTSEPFLRQVTCVSVYALLIFGGESLRWYYDPIIDQKKGNFDERNYSQATHCSIYDNDSYGVCVLDEWIYLACKKSLFENLYNLRQHFEWILFQRLRHLYWDWEKSIEYRNLMNCILKFLSLPPPSKRIGNKIAK